MSLTNKEFAKKNAFLNVIKSVNYNNPDMFSQSFSNKSMNKIACD